MKAIILNMIYVIQKYILIQPPTQGSETRVEGNYFN